MPRISYLKGLYCAIAAFLITPLLLGGVSAMGNTTPDGGRVGGLCYNANNQSVAVISLESEIKACTDQGFQTIDFGQPMPVSACIVGAKIQKLGDNSSERTACINTLGGKVVEAGEPFPGMIVAGGAVNTDGSYSYNDHLEDFGDCKDPGNCGITRMIVVITNILAGVVGIVIVIMIVWGGIQYTSSRDNPQQAAAAKEHVRNAIIALVLFIFSIAILNWLVPGGVFTG